MKKQTKNKIYLTTILILLLFISFKLIQNTKAKKCDKVNEVIDGDTVIMDDDKKIRILGIDAYDSRSKRMIERQMSRTNKNREEVIRLALEGTTFATTLLKDECVELKKDYKDIDIYGRHLRYVYIHNIDYGSLMLKKGLANVYCGDKRILKFDEYESLSEFKCY
jgi:endonuclease YncB( thermonuclease family)